MYSKLSTRKIKPRLNVSRSSQKLQETGDAPKKVAEEAKPEKKEEPVVQIEPEKVFSPPPPPSQLPRIENSSSTSQLISNFRKPKPTPRLSVARSSQKLQETCDSPKKQNEIPPPSPVPSEPDPVFSPPPLPISASPMRVRSDTPREFLQSPTYIVNHNIHHPPTPQSPFLPIPHARIRTESLCSNKSIPANLQPRKKFRTEDQKILDNKRESRERLSSKNVEKSKLRMFDMIYYNPSTNPMKERVTTKDETPEARREEKPLNQPEKKPSEMPVPQLRLNAQGELVLDETSLVVENEEHRKNRILLANTNVIHYDELSANYGFYKRQKRTREWPHEETVKFYRCLNTVGTDFSLMLNLFPSRSRRDLKLKFKKEEKTNPGLVDKALLKFNSFDIEDLQRELDREEEEKRKESENGSSEVKEIVKRKILKKQEARAKAQAKSKIEKILTSGDEVINCVDNDKKHDTKENLRDSIDKALKREVRKREPRPKKEIVIVVKQNEQESQPSSTVISPDEEILSDSYQQSQDYKKEEKNVSSVVNQTILPSIESSMHWESSNQTQDSVFEETRLSQEAPLDEQQYFTPKNERQEEEYQANPYFIEPQQEFCYQQEQNFTYENQNEHHEFSYVNQEPEEIIENPPAEPAPTQIQPTTSTDSAFDEESFLNSLNLEQLAIVVRQVNGENLYEIHETDPVTQLISDKPISLPDRLKDVLISVLTQDD